VQPDELNGYIRQYKDKKISWVDLAKVLVGLQDGGVSFNGLILPPSELKKFSNSYRFAMSRRPQYESRLHKVSVYAINYLPLVYPHLTGTNKDADFEVLIDKVMNGQLSEKRLKDIVRSIKGTDQPTSGRPIGVGSALEGAILSLEYILDRCKEEDFKALRKRVGPRCLKMALKLNCIGDGEFEKLWKERKEIIL